MEIGSWRYRGDAPVSTTDIICSCIPHDSSGDARLDGESSGRGLDWFDLFWMATA